MWLAELSRRGRLLVVPADGMWGSVWTPGRFGRRCGDLLVVLFSSAAAGYDLDLFSLCPPRFGERFLTAPPLRISLESHRFRLVLSLWTELEETPAAFAVLCPPDVGGVLQMWHSRRHLALLLFMSVARSGFGLFCCSVCGYFHETALLYARDVRVGCLHACMDKWWQCLCCGGSVRGELCETVPLERRQT